MEFLPEIVQGVDGRIDFAMQFLFCFLQMVRYLLERHIPDDHKVNVAHRRVVTSGHRSVKECHPDRFLQRLQCLLEAGGYPGGFDKDPLEVIVYGVVGVGSIIDLVSTLLPEDEPQRFQVSKLSLHGTRAALDGTGDLPDVHAWCRFQVKGAENLCAGSSQEQLCHIVRSFRTHSRNNCTNF